MEEKKTPAGRAGKWALWATAVPAAFGIVPYMILRAPGQSEGLLLWFSLFCSGAWWWACRFLSAGTSGRKAENRGELSVVSSEKAAVSSEL
jgi:hypothetical protein